MAERFVEARLVKPLRISPYYKLCGKRLRTGDRLHVKLPDGLIIRDAEYRCDAPMFQDHVVLQLHGIAVLISIREAGVTFRRADVKRRAKRKTK
jgi:hypothetical protein